MATLTVPILSSIWHCAESAGAKWTTMCPCRIGRTADTLAVTLNYRACGYTTGYTAVTSRVQQTTHAGYNLQAIQPIGARYTGSYNGDTGYRRGYKCTTGLVSAIS